MSEYSDHCGLCGLMCPLQPAETQAKLAPADTVVATWSAFAARCQRRTQWLQAARTSLDALSALQPSSPELIIAPESGDRAASAQAATAGPPSDSLCDRAAQRLEELVHDSDGRLLLWIDGGDVATMRAAVEFAKRSRASLHVGNASGSQVVRRVMASDGWLGASLAEVATHADLVITLGNHTLCDTPMLAERFLQRCRSGMGLRWWHIEEDAAPSASKSMAGELRPERILHWPRAEWYNRLTQLQLAGDALDPISAEVDPLRRALTGSQYAVWIWENGQLTSSLDELLVRRLLSIARLQSQTSRCGLLNIDAQLGQLTAGEVLLWLTGCGSTAVWNGHAWDSPERYRDLSLQGWRDHFSRIVVLRSTPTLGPPPELQADLSILCATDARLHARPSLTDLVLVAAAGVDYAAHLFRGDGGTMLRLGPTVPTNALPTAADIMLATIRRLSSRPASGAPAC